MSTFNTFHEVSDDEVRAIIRSSSITTCQTDPLPSTVLKESLNELLPVMTTIINHSLTSGLFPSCLRHAFIKPLLKSAKLDVDDLASFRPVSNLPYLGKLIERAAVNQIKEYLHDGNLYPTMQSAYRQNHSTETATLHIQTNLLCALDCRGEALLV